MRGRGGIGLLILVVLAGCSGITQPAATPSSSATPTDVSTSTPPPASSPTPTRTKAPTATASPTVSPTPDLGSPFGQRRVYIAYSVESNPHNQSFSDAFRRAVSYWNNAGNQYTTYPVTFTPTNDTERADVLIKYGVSANDCYGAYNESYVGCAPILDETTDPDSPAIVRIEAGYTLESTVNITQHELGHVVGIEHGEEPMPLMAEESEIPTVAKRDAVNRTNPWGRTNLTYYIPNELSAAQQSQVRTAFDFFNNGAAGATTVDWAFRETPYKSRADVVVTVSDSDDWYCDAEFVSCGLAYGVSPDADRRLEQYTYYRISLSQTASYDETGWWTALWLYYATSTLEDELPPEAFLDLSYEQRRDAWWTDL